jgi:hypothetical protein
LVHVGKVLSKGLNGGSQPACRVTGLYNIPANHTLLPSLWSILD